MTTVSLVKAAAPGRSLAMLIAGAAAMQAATLLVSTAGTLMVVAALAAIGRLRARMERRHPSPDTTREESVPCVPSC